MDLLEHVVLVAAELDGLGIPVHLEGLALDGLARSGEHPYRRVGYLDDLTVLDDEELVRLPEQGLHGAGQEVLPFPEPDDERALVAGRDDLAGLLHADRRDREGPFEPPEHPGERLAQRLPGLDPLGDQVRHHLRVRLGTEGDAPPLQLLLELREVLDDAVVDDGDAPISAEVGMRVLLAGTPVRRPAGVSHPGPHPGEVPVAPGEGRAGSPSRPTSFICSIRPSL